MREREREREHDDFTQEERSWVCSHILQDHINGMSKELMVSAHGYFVLVGEADVYTSPHQSVNPIDS